MKINPERVSPPSAASLQKMPSAVSQPNVVQTAVPVASPVASSLPVGKSLVQLPLLESDDLDLEPSHAIPLKNEEMAKVLDDYNIQVKAILKAAPQGSQLQQFKSALRMMSLLQDPRLKTDPQAQDILVMRKSQIEKAYQELSQSPEIKAVFEQARQAALKKIFGASTNVRAQQQAAYLLSNQFQSELRELSPEEIQSKVQRELSALALLKPQLAEALTPQLMAKTLRSRSLYKLQAEGEAGDSSRETLARALGIYLKTQQTASSVGLQANNVARLTQLSDQRINELSQAVARLTEGTKAADYQKLAVSLMDKVDQLPPDLQQDASRLLTHMQAQNIFGTILFAGSLAGLLQKDLPDDPKAWASLTSSSLSTAALSSNAFRLLGLENMADIAGKINFKAPVSGLQIPVVWSVVAGINTTLAAINLVDEVYNEDPIGTASQALGVGSGLAAMAAMTLLSGPAAPLTLIGTSVVGLAAWGMDLVWGESDLTGTIRQDLRTLGIAKNESEILHKYSSESQHSKLAPNARSVSAVKALEKLEHLAQTSSEEKVALINQWMDQYTGSTEEDLIFQTLTLNGDTELLSLMENLNTGRLASELENSGQVLSLMFRVSNLSETERATKVLEPMLERLTKESRTEDLQVFMLRVNPDVKALIAPEAIENMIKELMDGWFDRAPAQALITQLISDPDLHPQISKILAQSGSEWLDALLKNLPDANAKAIRTQLSKTPKVK